MSVFFFPQVKQIRKEKEYKQEIKESFKINKRRLVKVTPPSEGGAYIQNCVVRVSLLHLSVESSVRVSSSLAPGAPAVIQVCRTLRRGCCSVSDVLASPAGIPGRC